MVYTGTKASAPRAHPLSLALLACLQNGTIGGVIYGWASIDRTMLAASKEDRGAGLSLAESTAMFSWASSVAMVAALVLGVILDRFGPRVCSVVGHLFIAFGFLLFASATSLSEFTLATCLISFGGPGIQISIVHLANLFPENQFLALSIINGIISMSFAVFAIFDSIWHTYPSADFRTLFGGFSLVVMVSLVLSIYWWPDTAFELPEEGTSTTHASPSKKRTVEDDYIEASTSHTHLLEQPMDSYLRDNPKHILETHGSFVLSRKALDVGIEDLVDLKDQPFYRQFGSGTYVRALLTLTVTCFVANFYVASFSTELADSQDYPEETLRTLTRTFTLIMSAGVMGSLVSGLLMDRLGLQHCTCVLLALGVVQALILIVFHHHTAWMILSFVIYTQFRALLFPLFIASITSQLGFKYFGLLNGLGFAIAGIAQVFMVSLVELVQGDCHYMDLAAGSSSHSDCNRGKWTHLHVAQVIVLLGLMLAPVLQHMDKVRRKRAIQMLLQQRPSFRYQYGSLLIQEEGEESEDEQELVEDSAIGLSV